MSETVKHTPGMLSGSAFEAPTYPCYCARSLQGCRETVAVLSSFSRSCHPTTPTTTSTLPEAITEGNEHEAENIIDNPQSWIAWKRHADSWRRVAERLEAEKRLLEKLGAGAELLAALRGIVGLVQMVRSRPDCPPDIRRALTDQYRMDDAFGAIASAEGRAAIAEQRQ